jgi:hypothetical protein
MLSEWKNIGSRSLFLSERSADVPGGRGEMRDAGFEDRRCSVGRWRECVTFFARLTLLE